MGGGRVPMSGVLELLKALTGGVCLVCLAVTCRVTTDLSKTCISFALCGSLVSVVWTSLVNDWLEDQSLCTAIRIVFGMIFFIVLAAQAAITVLKFYTARRDGVPFDEVRVPFEEAVEDIINPVLENWGCAPPPPPRLVPRPLPAAGLSALRLGPR